MAVNAYTDGDIAAALDRVGLAAGDHVYVISALWQLGAYEGGAAAVAEAYLKALRQRVGPAGTIVVSTASVNLCNTETVFDPAVTPSFNVGALSEHLRLQPDARRSFHPFNSYAAVGALAEELGRGCSRHAFGPCTPEARLIEAGAKLLTVGVPPNICSTVHHVEQVMAVPYRYTKEFIHPVMRDGAARREPFYLHVRYREVDVERSHNKHLFGRLAGRLEIQESSLGRGRIYSYSMADFYCRACEEFAENIYVWCEQAPTIRPYQK